MPVWKKVIVSGSTANLPSLQVDNLNSGEAVIGGGALANLSTRVISGSGAILASGGTNIQLSGSFSGSFRGDGTGLTGVTAASAFALTFGEGIGLTAQGSASYNGNLPVTITVSGAADLTDGRLVKWDNVANKFANSLISDDATSVYITGSTINVTSSAIVVTGSVRASAGFTGSLFGTSSWALNAVTASFVTSAQTASFIATASWATNAVNALTASSIRPLTQNVSITGSLILSGSPAPELIVIGDTQFTGSVSSVAGFTGSLSGTATQVSNTLTAGAGLAGTPGSTYNGSTATTFNIGQGALITVNADDIQVATSSLTTNQIPKFSANTLTGTNILDTGTQVQIGVGASAGLSVAAGGVNVTGNSTFNSNVNIVGSLNVAGTASFTNTDSLFVADKFIALASGSTTLTQAGIIAVGGTTANASSGSAIFLDNVGTQGRWAVTASLNTIAQSAVGVNEYVVSVTVNQASAPTTQKPVWGSDTGFTNAGSMWVTTGGDIFIYV